MNIEENKKLWAKKHLECPICRVAFKENQFQRDLVEYNMVNELEVYCNNYMYRLLIDTLQ